MNYKKHGIILNRMYDGKYLQKNLGHEVINLFTSDQNEHYIYLNSDGKVPQNAEKNIIYDKMLLVKRHCEGIIEVIGKAVGLKEFCQNVNNQNDVDEVLNITYGNARITDIFSGELYQDFLITYQAKAVYEPEERMFIFLPSTRKQSRGEDVQKQHIKLEQELLREKGYKISVLNNAVQALRSQRQYIADTNDSTDDYHQLMNTFFNSNEGWVEVGERHKIDTQKVIMSNKHRISLFDICEIYDDEICFSNALAYFMNENTYRSLWVAFFKQELNIDLNVNYKIKREERAKVEDKEYTHTTGGNIDLCIRDEKNLIIIENKIKSGINTIKRDQENQTQLNRYLNYATWLTQSDRNDSGKKVTAIILVPNYNRPNISIEMEQHWHVKTYEDVYNFLAANRSVFKHDINFVGFFEAIKRHKYKRINERLYASMKEKFYSRIRQLKEM